MQPISKPTQPALTPATAKVTCKPENSKYLFDNLRLAPQGSYGPIDDSDLSEEKWANKEFAIRLSGYLEKGLKPGEAGLKEKILKQGSMASRLNTNYYLTNPLKKEDCLVGLFIRDKVATRQDFGTALLGLENSSGSQGDGSAISNEIKNTLINRFTKKLSHLQQTDKAQADKLVALYSKTLNETKNSPDLASNFTKALDAMDGTQDNRITLAAVLGEKAAQQFVGK
jgi:hypothetical protein